MNRVVLIGRLTKDPDLKFIQGSGTAVTNFILAIDRRFAKEGQQQADFVPIVVFGKIAEATANYMRKGSQIGINGRIQTRNYENKEGQKVYVTEVIADEVEFLGNKKNNQTSEIEDFNEDITPINDGEIPF
ncbi:single-stranded DNA-binding protein [Clostridium cochlearium]|uniref:Single-stranded DNA-binding protein n=1 Tax=Clostridium cochlearium TaxID=1494 RepID=A0A2X2VYC8_CLOCO|nr:single-stranded DNA-binding protein [Clostridium cochlearium]MBV1816883.1 single-stranded DNA-binding protein [Bacteroidales bacterium MSK.15.36]NSJ90161.1 single-stranded DNA-binding protein [Coprococcus sp. MSK.21.13]MCG4571752.1 single-stranded DNA-binding protein [Clostridium cochlearium]MCG4579081.1 single-stranded DNA-binding protein [Clostridium cochlearium]SQB33414.1 single-strand binding protein [Clostridium cochlearium]